MLVIKHFVFLHKTWWRKIRQYFLLVPVSHSLVETGLEARGQSFGLWCWELRPNDFNQRWQPPRTPGPCPADSVAGRGKETQAVATLTTSVNNQHFIAFENAMSVLSTDYTFFIVCIHRHGMMELQLISRNEFIYAISKRNETEVPVAGSAALERAGPLRRLRRLGEAVNCLGPRMPLDYKSHSQDKKSKADSNTFKVSKGHTVNRRYHTIPNP